MAATATSTTRERPVLPLPDTVVPGEIRWHYAIVIVGIHLLALLALVPGFFSWTAVGVMVAGVFVFGQAINLCYHRVLAHKSCTLPKWLEHGFVVMALCCFEDTPAKWVATHRYHHKHSDHQDDPHTPLVNFLWSHVGWLLVHNRATDTIETYAKYAPDILRDRFYMKLEKSPSWAIVYVIQMAVFFAIGALVGWLTRGGVDGALWMGGGFVVWGVLVRTVAVWHITWSVNSVTHMFGYQNHDADDHSKNNWLVALLAVGEGWHNNHHADPLSANNRHRWWEIDITYGVIWTLGKLGLATEIKQPKRVRHAGRGA